MKLYNSIGPNPRAVTLFMAEKGIDIPRAEVDLMAGENRREPYLKVNPAGQMPALELDDGTVLTEITAVCEYLEELNPEPVLIGRTAEERARTRMWTRRVDLKVCEPMANGFRFSEGLKLFEGRMRCLPEAAPGLKAVAQDGLQWLEANFEGPYLVGSRFSLADILLFSFLEFGARVGQPLDPGLAKINGWYKRVSERESVTGKVPA
ncbi:glutathione S-transferase family protein [Phenylobacterium sp.]|uniref:glutathione S-transferase family protein n=1 Tax=Phenylobacterium sp. TaxID=1871053 RepID=UPI002F92631F